jgi:conjugal transfer mating pair stabilization protein TraN
VIRQSLLAFVLGFVLMGAGAAQMTIQEAREAGKALATGKRADQTLVPTSDAQARAVPGYNGTTLPQSGYFDDPDRLAADGRAQSSTDQSYRAATNADRTRPTFSNAEILSTTARATGVENDPTTFLAGETMGSSQGSCTPLPPGQGNQGWYEATCNSGTKVEEGTASCRVPLVVDATPGVSKYIYTCDAFATLRPSNSARRCGNLFVAPVAGGVCRERSRETVSYPVCRQGNARFCTEPDIEEGERITYECDSAAVARPYTVEQVGGTITERRDESQCAAAPANQTCELAEEVCSDPDPITRTVNGVSVTKACWGWERRYTCHRLSPANDCSALSANGQCTYLREDCLDDPRSGPCKVAEKVYRCPTPAAPGNDPKQYICGNDVYCINGDCEPIVREASTEFKDALVALHAVDDASKGFDPNNLTVFSGQRSTCHHKLFGLSNCCSGRGVPLLTPWLCDAAEQDLDRKDDKGLCHKVGSYCSDKVLGICVTKKEAHCCFESKLSRILQEQGRAQLGKPWGDPKKEQCTGFTLDEFARLDLSRMDFTEVYADFMDAAKLPSEVQAASDIQQKIQDYYALHGK